MGGAEALDLAQPLSWGDEGEVLLQVEGGSALIGLEEIQLDLRPDQRDAERREAVGDGAGADERLGDAAGEGGSHHPLPRAGGPWQLDVGEAEGVRLQVGAERRLGRRREAEGEVKLGEQRHGR
jgi:hypothetical protein